MTTENNTGDKFRGETGALGASGGGFDSRIPYQFQGATIAYTSEVKTHEQRSILVFSKHNHSYIFNLHSM